MHLFSSYIAILLHSKLFFHMITHNLIKRAVKNFVLRYPLMLLPNNRSIFFCVRLASPTETFDC